MTAWVLLCLLFLNGIPVPDSRVHRLYTFTNRQDCVAFRERVYELLRPIREEQPNTVMQVSTCVEHSF